MKHFLSIPLGAVAQVMCNPFLIYRAGYIPALHLCPTMHSMDLVGKSAQGSHDTTTAGWEEVSAGLGATGFQAASQGVAVSVTDKLKQVSIVPWGQGS